MLQTFRPLSAVPPTPLRNPKNNLDDEIDNIWRCMGENLIFAERILELLTRSGYKPEIKIRICPDYDSKANYGEEHRKLSNYFKHEILGGSGDVR